MSDIRITAKGKSVAGQGGKQSFKGSPAVRPSSGMRSVSSPSASKR